MNVDLRTFWGQRAWYFMDDPEMYTYDPYND